MRTSDFDYELPPELIAQEPLPRGESRLLVLDRSSGEAVHRRFRDLPEHLAPGDTLVLNDTRVAARRHHAARDSGATAEVLLLRPAGDLAWDALVRPGRAVQPGSRLRLQVDGEVLVATVESRTPEGGRRLVFRTTRERDLAGRGGVAPLPPYIRRQLDDEERYQTVFAREAGSAAAPTAGLHFTKEMLERLSASGVGLVWLTLHVGVDTFRPVKSEDVEAHRMHGEWYSISPEAADAIGRTRGRIVAAGTTVVRALETAAREDRSVRPGCGETRLFITPGYRFRIVEGILTNFHLPRSTLIMLVSAFAGREAVLKAYREAVAQRYRFYSFGDAMLIL